MVSVEKRASVVVGICLVCCVAVCGWALADEVLAVAIEVAPKTLNLQNQGQVVTVHTDIAYGDVDGWSVTLNGLEIQSFKADDCGNFVAKFDIDAVKAMVETGDLSLGVNTLVLTGLTKDGENFEGATEIVIVDNGPKR